jgi:hypothetical protein
LSYDGALAGVGCHVHNDLVCPLYLDRLVMKYPTDETLEKFLFEFCDGRACHAGDVVALGPR